MFDIEFNPKESFLKQELAVSGITNNFSKLITFFPLVRIK